MGSSDTAWCPLCKRDVETASRFSWVIFLGLCILVIVPGIIYAVWALTRDRRCPICKSTVLYETETDMQERKTLEAQRPGGITYNKWSHRPYHVLLISTACVVGFLALVGAVSYEAPLTPEQEAEVRATPLTDEQQADIIGDRQTCAMVSFAGPAALEECLRQANDKMFDYRRDNWEAAQGGP